MLQSFVAKKDYYKLIDIIAKIKNDTLRQEASILVLYGDFSNGKTTLSRIMERAAPSSSRIDPEMVINMEKLESNYSIFSKQYHFIKTITSNSYIECEFNKQVYEISLDNIHMIVNKLDNSGVVVVLINELPTLNFTHQKRMPIILNLPYHHQHESHKKDKSIIDISLQEIQYLK